MAQFTSAPFLLLSAALLLVGVQAGKMCFSSHDEREGLSIFIFILRRRIYLRYVTAFALKFTTYVKAMFSKTL